MDRGEVYRFLLRMPEELRERLAHAAEESGRSLNREIVARLEGSLQESVVQFHQQGEGHSMRRNIRRPALAVGFVAAVAILVAVVGGVSRSPHVQAVKSPKLSGDPDRASLIHNARARTAASEKALKQIEGIRSPQTQAVEDYVDRALPGKTIPFSWKRNAVDYFTGSIRGRGFDDTTAGWQLAGPSTATVPTVLNRTNADAQVSGRITALAIDPGCTASRCRLWLAAAGGGVWRTDNALASNVAWKFISGDFATNAIGALVYDAASHTLYAGTGEANASADSEAGVGIYASQDGGDHWSLVPGSAAISAGNAISSIALDPNHPGTWYVGTDIAIRGITSTSAGYAFDPSAPKVGVYKTTNNGSSFSLVYDDSRGPDGVNHVEIDAAHDTVYAAAYGEGIYRSKDGGATWEHVFTTQDGFGRTEFALNQKNGHTRIWVGDGGTQLTDANGNPIPTANGAFLSDTGVYMADAIDTKTAADLTDGTSNPGYHDFSTDNRNDPGYLTYDYCWAQCWYDNEVISPAGHPDTVYVIGAYNYDFPLRNNGRTVLLSTDAGASWYDQTADEQGGTPIDGIHPDQHAIVVNPTNELQFFEGSDGGLVRSSGQLTNGDEECDNRGLSTSSPSYTACRNALAQIPTRIDTSVNAGLSTLQFQNIAVNPTNGKDVEGGTQDNGTWEGTAGAANWPQTLYGDGGTPTFDIGNPHFRMNEFFNPYSDVSYQDGAPLSWVTVSGPIAYSGEATAFYKPQIGDPVVGGTQFMGGQHVWRTQDDGGLQGQDGPSSHCTEFQPGLPQDCGDFVALGDPSGKGGPGTQGDLTASGVYGTDKTGGYVVTMARAKTDRSTMWVATRRGRVFISKNIDAAGPLVQFTRIDAGAHLAAGSLPTPRRYVSSIIVDPTNANHAYISFSGYNSATDGVTPAVPGHVFDVTYDPLTGTATWRSLDHGNGPIGDFPINGLALDEQTSHLYAATDFGVLVQTGGAGSSGTWKPAASGMPMVAVTSLVLDPKSRVLYASTHGRAIWSLQLAGARGKGH